MPFFRKNCIFPGFYISNLKFEIADLKTNQDNVNATFQNLESQIGLLALAIKQQSSRPIPSINEDDDIWECDLVPLSFDEKISSPVLVEKKDNELVIKEESLLEEMQVKGKNTRTIVENVLVGVENFIFSINFVTWGMEED